MILWRVVAAIDHGQCVFMNAHIRGTHKVLFYGFWQYIFLCCQVLL